jgi:adenylate cyclase
MTAYFSDIAGFSSISEKLTPSQLVQALNEYLTEMCNIIVSHDGTVDKYEGDAIISFWGAPIVQKDHARLACHASIEMSKRIIELADTWAAAGIPDLKVRMGLNSGPMVVGNMGSAQRMNYTIMGDAVNLAARLEGANKAYGSCMMISDRTYQACKDHIDVRELDTIRVVGKKEAVTVYELLDKKNETPTILSELVVQFSDALAKYKDKDFLAAKDLFDNCLKIIASDGPSRVYSERCALYLERPPPLDWDRVFTLTEKG